MSGKCLSNTLKQYSDHTGQVEWNFNKSIHHLDAIMQNMVYISHTNVSHVNTDYMHRINDVLNNTSLFYYRAFDRRKSCCQFSYELITFRKRGQSSDRGNIRCKTQNEYNQKQQTNQS